MCIHQEVVVLQKDRQTDGNAHRHRSSNSSLCQGVPIIQANGFLEGLPHSQVFSQVIIVLCTLGGANECWFDELMAFWEACPNLPLFEHSLLTIFTRFADHTSRYLDGSKYIPKFFSQAIIVLCTLVRLDDYVCWSSLNFANLKCKGVNTCNMRPICLFLPV